MRRLEEVGYEAFVSTQQAHDQIKETRFNTTCVLKVNADMLRVIAMGGIMAFTVGETVVLIGTGER